MEKDPEIEKYNISGKGLTAEQKAETSVYLQKKKEAAMKPMEGELEKTDEELKFIEKINEYLNEQFKELELDKKADLEPGSFHFLTPEAYKNHIPSQALGFYDAYKQRICMNKSVFEDKSIFYYAMLHEAIHSLSYQGFHQGEEDKDGIPLFNRKSGYRITNPENYHHHLGVLNEMVIEEIWRKIINKHARDISVEFNFSGRPNIIEELYLEHYDIKILDEIVKRIAEKKQEKEEDVWARFERGLFTGETMHLRDIERAFGKDALKVLGSLNILETDKDFSAYKKNYNEVWAYFLTEDQEGRDRIAKEILSKNHAAY